MNHIFPRLGPQEIIARAEAYERRVRWLAAGIVLSAVLGIAGAVLLIARMKP